MLSAFPSALSIYWLALGGAGQIFGAGLLLMRTAGGLGASIRVGGWLAGGGNWYHSVCPSFRPAFRVRSVTPTFLDEFFPYQAQMIISMRECHA